MRWKYIIIPLIAVLVAWSGSVITQRGAEWYQTIRLPSWTPSGFIISIVWTIIFILTVISALIVYHQAFRDNRLWWILLVFLINAELNILWSYFFFGRHLIDWASGDAAFLGLSVVVLILLIWPISRWAAIFLTPYAAWAVFITYLTYTIWQMNI